MLPANATILKCPHCGAKKEVLTLASGNTCGETQWSDCKKFAPMLPRVSAIQRCPQCGHYYYYTSEVEVESSNAWSANKGELPLEYLKEALKQLQPTGEDEYTVRLYLVWAFNDRYGTMSKEEIPADEWNYYEVNVRNLIPLAEDPLLKAELYREIEEYDAALALLEKMDVETNILPIKEMFLSHTLRHDRKVFTIYGNETREAITLDNYKE